MRYYYYSTDLLTCKTIANNCNYRCRAHLGWVGFPSLNKKWNPEPIWKAKEYIIMEQTKPGWIFYFDSALTNVYIFQSTHNYTQETY